MCVGVYVCVCAWLRFRPDPLLQAGRIIVTVALTLLAGGVWLNLEITS